MWRARMCYEEKPVMKTRHGSAIEWKSGRTAAFKASKELDKELDSSAQ